MIELLTRWFWEQKSLTGGGGLSYRQQFANQRHRLFDGDRLVGQLYEDGVNVAELLCVFHASPA